MTAEGISSTTASESKTQPKTPEREGVGGDLGDDCGREEREEPRVEEKRGGDDRLSVLFLVRTHESTATWSGIDETSSARR